MTDYLTSAELKATLELTGETFADDDVSLAITSASRAIDNICSRRFYLDADSTSVRFYTARNHRIIEIDDLVTFTSLEMDINGDGVYEDTWVEDTDFVFEPFNAVADGEPFTVIRRRRLGTFRMPTWIERGVRLTGQFGWAAVPSEVKSATGILAARLISRSREAPFGVIGFGMDTANAVQIARTDPDVQMLVAPYVKKLML